MKSDHPRRSVLALYAGNDIGWWDRLRVYSHARNCPKCTKAVDAFRRDRDALRNSAVNLPEDLDWNSLAAEMTANIRVGLVAGQCIEGKRRSRDFAGALGWRPAAVFASIAAMVAGGYWLGYPGAQNQGLSSGQRMQQVLRAFNSTMPEPARFDNVVTVGSTREGLEVKQNGAVLRMTHPGVQPSVITASTTGSVRARYIDDETGQVTITNVYSQ